MSVNDRNFDKQLILPKICFSTKKLSSLGLLNEDFTNNLITKNQKCSNIVEKSRLDKSFKFSNLYLNFKTKNNSLSSCNPNNFEQPSPLYNKITCKKNNNYLRTSMEKKQDDILNSSREMGNSEEFQIPNNKNIKIINKFIKYCGTKNNNKINKRNIESISNKFITYYFKKESKKLQKTSKNSKLKSFNQKSLSMTKKLSDESGLLTNLIISSGKIDEDINFERKKFERNRELNKKLPKNVYSVNNNGFKKKRVFFLSTHESKKSCSPIKNYCKVILKKKESRDMSKNNRDFRKEEDKDINIISNGRFDNDNM